MKFDKDTKVSGLNIEDRRTLQEMIAQMLRRAAEYEHRGDGAPEVEDVNDLPPPPPMDEPGPMPEITMPDLSPLPTAPKRDDILSAVMRRIGKLF